MEVMALITSQVIQKTKSDKELAINMETAVWFSVNSKKANQGAKTKGFDKIKVLVVMTVMKNSEGFLTSPFLLRLPSLLSIVTRKDKQKDLVLDIFIRESCRNRCDTELKVTKVILLNYSKCRRVLCYFSIFQLFVLPNCLF